MIDPEPPAVVQRRRPSFRGVGAAAIVVGLLFTAQLAVRACADARGIPKQEINESGLDYPDANIGLVAPMGEERILVAGLQMRNPTERAVRVLEVEPVGAEGLTATAALRVGGPRMAASSYSVGEFPPDPSGRWDPDLVRAMGPFTVAPDELGRDWGELVLVRLERQSDFAHLAGYWIRGEADGMPFRDFVPASLILCRGETVNSACDEYERMVLGVE